MHSIDNVARIIVKALQLEYPNVQVAHGHYAGAVGTNTGMFLSADVGALPNAGFSGTQGSLTVDLAFVLVLRLQGTVEYSMVEDVANFLYLNKFEEAAQTIKAEEELAGRAFNIPWYLEAQITAIVPANAGDRVRTYTISFTIPEVCLGTVNAPEAQVVPIRTVTIANQFGESKQIYP